MLRPLIIASSSIQSLKMINCNFFKKSVSLEKWYVYQVDHVYVYAEVWTENKYSDVYRQVHICNI